MVQAMLYQPNQPKANQCSWYCLCRYRERLFWHTT